MPVYEPSDDSYLLSESIKEYLESIESIINQNNKAEQTNNKSNQHPSSLKFHNISDIHNDFKILDMGSGSGIQAETCRALGFNNILVTDINQEAIKLLKNKGFKTKKSNLFSNLAKKNNFNLIVFNPPYLPEDKNEPKESRISTTAGKKGYELIIKFLKQAKPYLYKQGIILLLISSLTNPKIIQKTAGELGYDCKIINKKKLFFEELYVYGLRFLKN